jgi:phosphonate transport system permease protein
MRAAVLAGTAAALTVYAGWRLGISLDALATGSGRLAEIAGQFLPPHPGDDPGELVRALLETVAMSFSATVLAGFLALPVALLGARLTAPAGPRFFARRGLDVLRGVDTLIWGMIFVSAVGLGPLAGVLAMSMTETGTLAKLFSEALDAADGRPPEALAAAGALPVLQFRYGVWPQVTPILLSHCLYYFESNIRSATVLGVVGAGGIGSHLADRLRAQEWQQAGGILLLILAVVAVVDLICRRLRKSVQQA